MPAVAKSDEYSAPNRKAQVRGSPGETLPCTLLTPNVRKIRRGRNVLLVSIQIIPLGYQSGGAIPSVEDQNCDGIMSPDNPQG